MFKEIFLFEFKYGFKKPSTIIYLILLFAFGLFLGNIAAGAFNIAQSDRLTVSNSAVAVSSFLIGSNSNIFGLVNSVIMITVIATAIYKDYQYNMHPLIFTKPITKPGYFWGRFLGAFVIVVIIFIAPLAGYWLGCLKGTGGPFMGPFNFSNFIIPFLIFVLPNILLQSIIFFSLTTFSRSTLPAYTFAIVILVVQIIAASVASDIDSRKVASIMEPTGQKAFQQVIEYWSPSQKNTRPIPFEGIILYNRLLWLSIAIVIGGISYYGFRFTQFLQPLTLFKRKQEVVATSTANLQSLADLPVAAQSFALRDRIKQFFYLVLFELKKLLRSPFFFIMIGLGITILVVIARFMDSGYNTPTYPVTYEMVEMVSGSFSLFIIIFIVFYAGTMVWRERESKAEELVWVTPVSTAAFYFSKLIALVVGVAAILFTGAICGIFVQLSKDFYQIGLGQYLVMVLTNCVYFAITAAVCIAIQTICSNKFLGFFISLIPILILSIVFSLLQWNSDLYDFNSDAPSLGYSDMNGYGGKFAGWFVYKSYWFSIAMVMCFLALLVFARGKEKSLKARFRFAKLQGIKWQTIGIAVFALLAAALGGFIFYQTKVLNKQYTPKETAKLKVQYEKNYSKYEGLLQPRIIASSVNVDIFPKEKSFRAFGSYLLRNNNNAPLDTLFINFSGGDKSPYTVSKLSPNVPFTQIINDEKYGIRILKLKQPLMPGDTIKMDFDMSYKPIGFFTGGESMVVNNGTFLNNMQFPGLGFAKDLELDDNVERKKYGLKFKPRMAAVNDSAARMNNYISNDADWMQFETTVSTIDGQIAIAPGYLQKDWVKDGRHYYQYKMDSPILNFYAYLSADYKVVRDKWKNVNIEIYYQKGHEYNLDRMKNSIKKSLDYYTTNFGPYQHRQVRIIEFPRYASFAQSFPNTIPYSEGIGFLTKVEKGPDKIDLPFYVTAHEVAHQWWAHQVIGGNVQGSVLLSETLSQYSALMVMEKMYGKQSMKKFLKYELDNYLRGRTFENKKELPLMLVENQSYIHYNKGSVIMYALSDYLGEGVLNQAIRNFLNKNKFKGPMYPNSVEFVNDVAAVTPDSLQYIITDFFKKITIYENYVKDLKYTKLSDGKFKVSLTVGSAKYYADSTGKDKRTTVNDYIDVGIFGEPISKEKGAPEKQLLLQRIKMDKPEKTFEFVVNELPISAGIDPYNKLIDRKPDNNTWKFGSTPPPVDLSEKKNTTIRF